MPQWFMMSEAHDGTARKLSAASDRNLHKFKWMRLGCYEVHTGLVLWQRLFSKVPGGQCRLEINAGALLCPLMFVSKCWFLPCSVRVLLLTLAGK